MCDAEKDWRERSFHASGEINGCQKIHLNEREITMRTIFASLARASERVHVQNVRNFPQIELDGEINSPFLLTEPGDPRIFFQGFAKNSLIKNIFEEEKKFDSGTRFLFAENSFQLSVFWPTRRLQANHRTVRKTAIFSQPSNQKQLCFQDKTLRLSSNQNLILYEGDTNFLRVTSTNTLF